MSRTSLDRLAASLLRIAIGVIVKLFVFTRPGTARYFSSIGLPGWIACLVRSSPMLLQFPVRRARP